MSSVRTSRKRTPLAPRWTAVTGNPPRKQSGTHTTGVRRAWLAGVSVLTALLCLAITSGAAASHSISIAGVGANFGNQAAAQICSSGDLTCTFTTLDTATFNGMSPAALRASYDVLIFTWISDPAINADWTTRLLPYMSLGGGVLFEDPGNLDDLAPGVTAFNFDTDSTGMAISAAVPGLTDGIADSFVNNHIGFTAWDPALSPFITKDTTVVGLWGRFDAGCIVLTGPDQHFHGFRGDPDPAGNQYNLLLNEVNFVTHGCGVLEVGIDIKPGGEPNSIKLSNKGVIPVAILSTTTFDATTVDPATVCFGDAEDPSQRDCSEAHGTGHVEDVNGDLLPDLVLHYETGETGIDLGDTEACLTGETFGGQPVAGCDSVRPL